MLEGFNVYSDGSGSISVYTDPFPRQGLAAMFTVQVSHVASAGGASLVPAIETKNHRDTTWTPLGSFSPIATAGVASLDVTGLKEEVRIGFVFSPAGSPLDFFRVYIPPPAWRPYT